MTRPKIYLRAWRKGHQPPMWWPPERLLTRTEAAALLGCSRRALWSLHRRGLGPKCEDHVRYEGSVRPYRLAEVVAWRNSVIGNGQPTTAEALYLDWERRYGWIRCFLPPVPQLKRVQPWRQKGIRKRYKNPAVADYDAKIAELTMRMFEVDLDRRISALEGSIPAEPLRRR